MHREVDAVVRPGRPSRSRDAWRAWRGDLPGWIAVEDRDAAPSLRSRSRMRSRGRRGRSTVDRHRLAGSIGYGVAGGTTRTNRRSMAWSSPTLWRAAAPARRLGTRRHTRGANGGHRRAVRRTCGPTRIARPAASTTASPVLPVQALAPSAGALRGHAHGGVRLEQRPGRWPGRDLGRPCTPPRLTSDRRGLRPAPPGSAWRLLLRPRPSSS